MPTKVKIRSPNNVNYKIRVPCEKRFKLYKNLLTARAGDNFYGSALPSGGALARLEAIARNQNYNFSALDEDGRVRAEGLGLRYKRRDYSIFERAFKEDRIKEIIKKLVKIIDPWVALHISLDINHAPFAGRNAEDQVVKIKTKDGRITHLVPTPHYNAYMDDEINHLGQADYFWARKGRLRDLVVKLTDNFLRNIEECCARVFDDWGKINEVFFPGTPNQLKALQVLKKITPTGSDFHKGGKQVLILTFQTRKEREIIVRAGGGLGRSRSQPNPQEEKLVYKPSDLRLDCLLLGDTSFFAHVEMLPWRPHHNGPSLLELIKEKLEEDGIIGADEPFPTYRILPIDTGDVTQAYGYMEYLTFIPETEITPAQVPVTAMSEGIRSFIRKNSRSWQRQVDYVLVSDQEIQRYYRTWGRLMASAFTFSMTDLHWENVRNHHRLPYLIDVEDSLKWPMNNIEGTGLQGPVKDYAVPSRNETEFKIENDEENNIKVWWLPSDPTRANVQVWRQNVHNGPIVQMDQDTVKNNLEHLLKGFIQVMTVFYDHRVDFRGWVNAKLPGVFTRFVPIKTADYYKMNFIYNAFTDFMEGATQQLKKAKVKQYLIDYSRKYWAGQNRDAKGANLRPWWSHPCFLLATDANDFRDYENGDIPYYYRIADQAHLYNSQGNQVDLTSAWNEQVGTPDAPRYLPHNFTLAVGLNDEGDPRGANHQPGDAQHCTEAGNRRTANQYFPDTQIQMVLDNLPDPEAEAAFKQRVLANLDRMYNPTLAALWPGVGGGGRGAMNIVVAGRTWSIAQHNPPGALPTWQCPP